MKQDPRVAVVVVSYNGAEWLERCLSALLVDARPEVPFEVVVAGVHQQLFSRLPARFRRQEIAMARLRSLPVVPIGLGPTMVSRLWQAASFVDSRVVKPIVLGSDELTRQLNVVDAASFSAAIPGVLHSFVDTALHTIAFRSGRLVYLPDVLVEHMHPLANKAPVDEVHRYQETYTYDSTVFYRWQGKELRPIVERIKVRFDQPMAA